VLKAKRKLLNKAQGLENAGPLVVDSQLAKWPESELIGNGSTVIAKIHFWGWSRAGEGVGLSAELHGLQIVKHVPYTREEPSDGGFAAVPGGAVAPVTDPEAAAFGEQLTAAAQAAEEDIPF
jgi:hypothetical protein